MYSSKIEPFEKKIWLSTPTMHKAELEYVEEAYRTNWVSSLGANNDEVERIAAETTDTQHAVALSSCTAAIHLAVKLAGEKLYGRPAPGHGALEGRKVFCSDMSFIAVANPILYEGGIPVYIDTDPASWNMDPAALEKAFAQYPDTGLVVLAHLYGFPADIVRIREICDKNGALLIEDAAEAVGATVAGRVCGAFGDYGTISYNGNKIITGSGGGCLVTNDAEAAAKARKWSTQSREAAAWYQHEETGYNYRMSNIVAGIVRGQYEHLAEHMVRKKEIYCRYAEGLKGLPLKMSPQLPGTEPNYWLSCLIIDEDAMCPQQRGALEASYTAEHGKTCPTEILEALNSINAEGRPIWKPMHLQPLFSSNEFISLDGQDIGSDIFMRGCCLPSDIKMTAADQDRIIEAIKACFN